MLGDIGMCMYVQYVHTQLWVNSTIALWGSWERPKLREQTRTENPEWSPKGGYVLVFLHIRSNSCNQTVAKRRVLHSFAFSLQGRQGDSDAWGTQDLHILCPDMHHGEDTP